MRKAQTLDLVACSEGKAAFPDGHRRGVAWHSGTRKVMTLYMQRGVCSRGSMTQRACRPDAQNQLMCRCRRGSVDSAVSRLPQETAAPHLMLSE